MKTISTSKMKIFFRRDLQLSSFDLLVVEGKQSGTSFPFPRWVYMLVKHEAVGLPDSDCCMEFDRDWLYNPCDENPELLNMFLAVLLQDVIFMLHESNFFVHNFNIKWDRTSRIPLIASARIS
ncbi:hypothetical protein ACJX0J_022544 [Zea mays]